VRGGTGSTAEAAALITSMLTPWLTERAVEDRYARVGQRDR